jgi:hypothetical protein
MTWLSRIKWPNAGATSAQFDAARAAASAAHAVAIRAELAAQYPTPDLSLSYDDAVAVVCHATGWPVGHVWSRTEDGWQSSGAWHDAGPQYADLKAATAATNLGSGRGIVAAVLYLEACRFLPGLEGLGSAERQADAAAVGLAAVVGVPVRVSGKLQAVFEFITDVEIEPEGALADALLAVADRTRRRVPRTTLSVLPRNVSVEIDIPAKLAG